MHAVGAAKKAAVVMRGAILPAKLFSSMDKLNISQMKHGKGASSLAATAVRGLTWKCRSSHGTCWMAPPRRFMSEGAKDGSDSKGADTPPAAPVQPTAAPMQPKPPAFTSLGAGGQRPSGSFASFSAAPARGQWGAASLGSRVGMMGTDPYKGVGGLPLNDINKPPGAPDPTYDPALLEKLGISHIPAWRIAQVLQADDITLEELAQEVDAQLHMVDHGEEDDDLELGGLGWLAKVGDTPPEAGEDTTLKKVEEWSPSMLTQLLPVRKFYPGQSYEPKDLSPKTEVDWNTIRKQRMPKGCPLGGKKGPKIDWTNGPLIARYVTEGGNIKPRRATGVCAKKQRELARCVRRARVMGILARTSKPNFWKDRDENVDTFADATY